MTKSRVLYSGWRLGCRYMALTLFASLPSACLAQAPSGWLIHDFKRPRPTIVKPANTTVATPADAVVLFDGSDLRHWRSAEGTEPQWVIRGDAMESVPESGYLHTVESFGDVQLHLEWASPENPAGVGQERGNSGVFLMGKYELQVLDSYENDTYPDGQAAAIYGQYPPLVNACLPPGEWQTYDIVFRRPRFDNQGKLTSPARMSVLHNGVLVHDNRELWGPTSW
ncbi:MAG: 3-keto-disaccharide hydrolase, partial [Bythopirellula sp.]